MSKVHKENPYARIKKGESPKFKKGNPGRPKGAKDKVSRTVKENIEETFQKLGGIKGLIEWANKSNYNKEKVYSWYFSMLPKNVGVDAEGNITINIISRIPRSKKKKKKDGNSNS